MKNFLTFALAIILVILLIGRKDPHLEPGIREFHIIVVSILLEAIPFIILGSLVSGIIEVFFSRDLFARMVPRNRLLAVSLAGLGGLLFPICECGIIPVVRRLTRKGVPLYCAVTYMLAAPIINPVVIASTVVAFKGSTQLWPVTLGRIAGGFTIPVLIGLMVSIWFKGKETVIDAADHSHHEHGEACSDCGPDQATGSRPRKIVRVFRHAADDFFDIGKFLILGAFIAGFMRSISIGTGEDSMRLMDLLVGGGSRQVIAMMVLAVLLSLCSEADAFFSRAFPVSAAARLGFLVLGPMFDVKLLLMYFKVFRKRLILFLVVAILALNALCWLLAQLLMGAG